MLPQLLSIQHMLQTVCWVAGPGALHTAAGVVWLVPNKLHATPAVLAPLVCCCCSGCCAVAAAACWPTHLLGKACVTLPQQSVESHEGLEGHNPAGVVDTLCQLIDHVVHSRAGRVHAACDAQGCRTVVGRGGSSAGVISTVISTPGSLSACICSVSCREVNHRG